MCCQSFLFLSKAGKIIYNFKLDPSHLQLRPVSVLRARDDTGTARESLGNSCR